MKPKPKTLVWNYGKMVLDSFGHASYRVLGVVHAQGHEQAMAKARVLIRHPVLQAQEVKS